MPSLRLTPGPYRDDDTPRWGDQVATRSGAGPASMLVVDVMPSAPGWLVCAWIGSGGQRLECHAHAASLQVLRRGGAMA